MADAEQKLKRLRELAAEQAEDEALWSVGPEVTAPEHYLQRALRRLHEEIER